MLHKQIPAGLSGVAVFLAGLLLLPAHSLAQSFNYVSIDVPCSDCPGGIARQTTAFGINPAGDIVGTYTDAVGMQHGFLLSGGQFTTIDVPGYLVGVGGVLPTAARGINASGDIVGTYSAPVSSAPWGSPEYCPTAGSTGTACLKSFVYRHGSLSIVLYPGHAGAIAQRIEPDGTIYGCYHDYDTMGSMFGFALTPFGYTSLANGVYSSLAAGDGELADPSLSVPASMSNGGTPDGKTIIGLYVDMATGLNHGFVLRNGVLKPYDVPGGGTNIYDIDPSGNFVGIYVDSKGTRHGFLQPADGSAPITVDYPKAVHTRAYGINPAGAIVGHYIDTRGQTHGFLATPAPAHNQ